MKSLLCSIKKNLKKVKRVVKYRLSSILYVLLSLLFIGFIIWMIVLGKMSEIDTSVKYLIIPFYLILSIIFGEAARHKIEKHRVIVFRRQVDSRWATVDEIKETAKKIDLEKDIAEGAGIPLIVEEDGNKKIFVDDSESHTLIIGSTGSGKTRRIIMPLLNILSLNNESMIITDPKGELLEQVGGLMQETGYKVIVLNFRNPLHGNNWNPLSIPYALYKSGKKDKATEMLNDIALNIFVDNSNEKDPFWEQSSVDYFMGLALALFEDGTENQINLNSISAMSSQGMDKFGASTYIGEYFKNKDKFGNAYISASGTINAPSDTRSSIISVFNQKIRVYTSQDNLSKMLSNSDFDINTIGKEKTAIFVIVQDEKTTYHSLATAFIKQCYECLIDCASENSGNLPIRTNFVLDEFANLPAINDMESVISASRSRNIRLYLVIQSNKHLDETYGQANAEVIKNNCNNLVYVYGRELQTLRDISELCGEREIQLDLNTFEKKPLISTTELQHLEIGEMILLRKENYPFKIRIPDISKYGFKTRKYQHSNRTDSAPINHFDIQKTVKTQRQKKFDEMLASQSHT